MSNGEWMITCGTMGLIFLVFFVIFAVFQERAVWMISGFNTFSKEKQARYDRAAIARDYARMFLIWGLVMLAGAAGSWFLGMYAALAAFALWIVLFAKDFHIDPNKAFAKYQL